MSQEITYRPDIEGGQPLARYRFSKTGFRHDLAIAAGLTVLFCGFIWLILGIYGVRYMNAYTAITGLIFFAFISARTVAQYLRNEVVMAVQPPGLFDVRMDAEPIAWEKIKDLVLSRREKQFLLEVVLWPAPGKGPITHQLDISSLDAGPDEILQAINAYKPIRLEQ